MIDTALNRRALYDWNIMVVWVTNEWKMLSNQMFIKIVSCVQMSTTESSRAWPMKWASMLVPRTLFSGFSNLYLHIYTYEIHQYSRSSGHYQFWKNFVKFCRNIHFCNSLENLVGQNKSKILTRFWKILPQKVWFSPFEYSWSNASFRLVLSYIINYQSCYAHLRFSSSFGFWTH